MFKDVRIRSGLYMYAHPEANVVGVEPTWDDGFILKVRCNDAAQG